ncbi:MAG: prepilin peptidase [Bacteriovoracaceae bacterium]|nr:prepilin peptidase [Bacteriovoracaceae bacterium]
MTASLYFFIFIELLIVGYGDVKTRKVPNFWVLFNILLFCFFLFFFPQYFVLTWDTFSYASLFLVLGFILFLLKIMGGGDSKFLFSFFLIVPLSLHDQVFAHLLLSTLLIGTAVLIYNIIENFQTIVQGVIAGDIVKLKKCFGSKFAFIPVIFMAWLWLGWENKFFL